eukprot:RCo018371
MWVSSRQRLSASSLAAKLFGFGRSSPKPAAPEVSPATLPSPEPPAKPVPGVVGWPAPGSPMTIVVGISGTATGDIAIRAAFESSLPGDRIVGVFVPPSLPAQFPGLEEEVKEVWAQRKEMVTRRALTHATATVEQLRREGLGPESTRFEFHIPARATGSAKVAIVEACRALNADLLVL